MHRQSNYSYPYTAQTTPRYATSHSTSSAMSASANPDEDWTKISDLAERRRIQNRIAQRNYRKKLKKRLEDLERRAGSSSLSPEPPHALLVPVSQARPKDPDPAKKRKSKPELSSSDRMRSPNQSMSPHVRDDQSGMFSRQHTRQLSASPPPAFTYSYPMPEPPPVHAPYPQHHAPFHSLPAPYSDYPSSQSLYLPSLPVILPSMSSYEAASAKHDPQYADEDMLSHFQMNYSPMGGMEAPSTQSYADSNAYTPPLSLSHSFDHSRDGSPCDSSLMCPGTPVSMPVSPNYMMG